MHLHRAIHAKYYEKHPLEVPTKPRNVYFDNPEEFKEVKKLLIDTVEEFDLDMMCLEGCSFSSGLGSIIYADKPTCDNNNQKHNILAFILGTRNTDPNSNGQEVFAPSSDWMPPFMRVNPVLSWSYQQIWYFLRFYKLPYCNLYDVGYTSLGKVGDTFPCPALERSGDGGYYPAYMLIDGKREIWEK